MRVTYMEQSTSEQRIWVVDPRGIRTLIAARGVDPVWSPDGNWIAFSGGAGLYRTRADGTGDAELMLERFASAHSWSSDGTALAFYHIDRTAGKSDRDIWVLPLVSGEPLSALNVTGTFT